MRILKIVVSTLVIAAAVLTNVYFLALHHEAIKIVGERQHAIVNSITMHDFAIQVIGQEVFKGEPEPIPMIIEPGQEL